MNGSGEPRVDQAQALADLYDRALPQVYGYLVPRCGDTVLAEELTAETFMAAVAAVRHDTVADLTVAWLIAVARHKLVDHWRRREREQRKLALLQDPGAAVDDPWDAVVDAERAHRVLALLPPPQRMALTFRYLDALPVAQVADLVGRSVHATETLLVRARAAFRRIYEEGDRDGA